MEWYYRKGDQEEGPIDSDEMKDLYKAKEIDLHTLVRRSEQDDWKPLSDFIKKKADSSTTSSQGRASGDSAPDSSEDTAQPAAMAICSQCGRSFPEDQVVRFDDKIICAACKPIFVQKVKEGAEEAGKFRYGGFWIRVGAKIIDSIITTILQFIIYIPLGIIGATSLPDDPANINVSSLIAIIAIQTLVGIAIPAIYSTFFVGRFAATPGKMACGLKIVLPDGDRVSYARAFGRYFAEMLSAMILLIGYIMVAFDSEKRGLHDRICSTRVVYK
jgi:uncharacterized RDD family membrane protein YckC